MTLIVVIPVEKQVLHFPFSDNLSAQLDPISEIGGAVHDGLIPYRRHGLDLFAVAEPPDVGEVRSDEIKRLLQLPRAGHERGICQCQGHLMLPQSHQQFVVQPEGISNLNNESSLLRRFVKKYSQPFYEVVARLELVLAELRKLQQERT